MERKKDDLLEWANNCSEEIARVIHEDNLESLTSVIPQTPRIELQELAYRSLNDPDIRSIICIRVHQEIRNRQNRDRDYVGSLLPVRDYYQAAADWIFYEFLTITCPRYLKKFKKEYLNDVEMARNRGRDSDKARLRLLRFDKIWVNADWFHGFCALATNSGDSALLKKIGEAMGSEEKHKPSRNSPWVEIILVNVRNLFHWYHAGHPINLKSGKIDHVFLKWVHNELNRIFTDRMMAGQIPQEEVPLLLDYDFFIKTLRRYQIIPNAPTR